MNTPHLESRLFLFFSYFPLFMLSEVLVAPLLRMVSAVLHRNKSCVKALKRIKWNTNLLTFSRV